MALVGRMKRDSKVDRRGARRALAKMAICAELDSLPDLDRRQVVRELFAHYIEDSVTERDEDEKTDRADWQQTRGY